jgi:hypothetical protein
MQNLASVHLEIVLLLVQHRCAVCAKRTIGSEIVLVTSDGTPVTERTIGLKIILDAPDGTPR